MPIKSNADLFAERGDPWEVELPRSPRSPTGELRLNRRAHLYALTHKLIPETPPVENPDVDRWNAGVCEPINLRLARERNTLVKSMNAESKPSSSRSSVLAARVRLNKKRASLTVKVK